MTTVDYIATLYALGALPLSAAARGVRREEIERAGYGKGERADVNGWISPLWAKRGRFRTDTERERYASAKQPRTYSEYAALLDVDEYKRTHDPHQYAVLAFVLEALLEENIEIENIDDIIRVYDADIGLDDRALPLLKGRLSAGKAMHLYEKHPDGRLLDVLPVPHHREADYIQFLRNIAKKEPGKRWYALRLLYGMDAERYKEEFIDWTIHRVRETHGWAERLPLYLTLVDIGDNKALQAIAESLLTDPVTENREAIIHALLARNVYAKPFMDSVVQLAKGGGGRHEAVTPSRMTDQWRSTLREYLSWLRDSGYCDAATEKGVDDALSVLKR